MAKRIRVKDLAPFASIEDLSDERESPLEGDKPKTTLANIEEEAKTSKVCTTSTGSTSGTTNSPAAKMNLNVTSTTPRIDISRASSSSHHDDSSPERELILGKSKDSKLEVAFGEEIATELHSSTEELSFHENEDAEKNRLKKSSSHVVSLTDMQREALRKDSGCSADIAFLSISGRTSRVSSVGSVASGGSGISNISALSHCSGASCLSAVSNLSRGSSPHRTSVETSFCGKKPVHSASVDDEYAAIVSKQTRSPSLSANTRTKNRSADQPPPKPIKQQKSQTANKGRSKAGRKRPTIENPKTQKFVSLYSDEEDKSVAAEASDTKVQTPAATQPQPKAAKTLPGLDPRTQIYIPLRGDSVEEKTAASSCQKQIKPTCQPNPFSPKRLKPFTNATLISFISKYDALKDSPDISLPRRKMYAEFQKFISQLDDDDPIAGGRGSKYQSKVERITVPVQVHRSRSLSDNMSCTAVVEDTAQLSKSDTRIPPQTSPTLPAPRQSSLRLSDSLLEQHHSDSSQPKLTGRCHSALATTASSSLSFSSSVAPSNQSSQFLQLDHRGNRPAKSMTHLSTISKHNTSNSPTINVCAPSDKAPHSARSDEYPFRRCSESAKEMRNMDKMKSRSGSIKSLFRTFFKKNGDVKTEKTYHTDSAVEIESKPIHILKKTRASSTVERIIIPLHSPDYDYEAAAAAALSKKSSDDNDKKDDVTKKTAQVNPSCSEKKKPPDLPPKQVVSKAIVHQVSIAETSAATAAPPEASVGPNSSDRIESIAKTTVVQCHVPSSPVSSSCVSQQHLPHNSQQCSFAKAEACSGNHLQKSSVEASHHADGSGEVSSPAIEPYSSLSSTSKKANEEETDEALSTDSDKSHPIVHEHDEENKKLVNQEESFEELPYVPTTLPIERSVGIPIIPIKERSTNDMLVHSVERPRSMSCHMTSLNLNTATAVTTTTTLERASTSEKLRITLPRTDAVSSSPKWKRRNSEKCEPTSPSPPPLPPRKATKSASWICFDESRQPENRQSPRRITTLPSSYVTDQPNRAAGLTFTSVTTINVSSSDTIDGEFTSSINQRIVFVNPNECSCECHDVGGANSSSPSGNTIPVRNGKIPH